MTGPGRGFARSPSLPIAVLLGVTPALATAQFRAMALAVTIGFALAIAAHWRNHRRLPWPRATAPVLLVGALIGWTLVATLWSAEARHGLATALGLAALLLLAAMTARAEKAEATLAQVVNGTIDGGSIDEKFTMIHVPVSPFGYRVGQPVKVILPTLDIAGKEKASK
jgi:uncharacterized membrane protein YfcA